MSESPAVAIRGLRFAWPARPPLLAIDDFVIHRGERLLLRGPSGSGKSTLLGLVGGVLRPQQGSLVVLGTELARLSGSGRDRFRGEHLGFVFQQFNLLPYLGVLDNVLLPCRFNPLRARRAGATEGDRLREAERLLAALGLEPALWRERRTASLSVGQQQRVAAARALIGRPELVIADEPTSALDAEHRDRFLALLAAECRQTGAALLFVSHDPALAPHFDRVVELSAINEVGR